MIFHFLEVHQLILSFFKPIFFLSFLLFLVILNLSSVSYLFLNHLIPFILNFPYNDFKIIHIDASINLQSNNKIHDALERTYELYEFCYAQAKKLKKDILIEVGTEEQTGTTNTFEEIEFFLSKLVSFCKLKNTKTFSNSSDDSFKTLRADFDERLAP